MARWIKTAVRRTIVDAITPVATAAGFRLKKA
jgi:hypothetical protein